MDEKIERQKTRFILLFEVVKKSLVTCQFLLDRLKTSLHSYETDIDNNIQLDDKVIVAFADASALIDYINRFQTVITLLPFINKRTTEMNRFIDSMKSVTDLRNYLQHMNNDLSKPDLTKFDILGSISWTKNNICYTVSLSQPFPGQNYGIVFNKDGEWMTNCQYEINDTHVDFDKALNEMSLIFSVVADKAKEVNPDKSNLEWGQTMCYKLILNKA